MINNILSLSFALAASVLSSFVYYPPVQETAQESTHEATAKTEHVTVSADKALEALIIGNKRFASGKLKHPHETPDWRAQLEKGQHPFAVVLGCSDSRVPPELVFDQGLGDLFVIRVAGNVVDTDVTASIEYAIAHLDTQLIVVMGHTHCGAVTATLDHLVSADGEPAEVVSLLYAIEPAIATTPNSLERGDRISVCVKRNVEYGVRRLQRVPYLRTVCQNQNVRIVGAVYDMRTGQVNFLE